MHLKTEEPFFLYQLFNLVMLVSTPAKQLYDTTQKMFKDAMPGLAETMSQTDPDTMKTQQVTAQAVWLALNLLGALLILLGSIQMLRLRSYGLAVTASIVAAIPCISCTACCGVGEGIGIWALVVLMNPDVRAAFAAMR